MSVKCQHYNNGFYAIKFGERDAMLICFTVCADGKRCTLNDTVKDIYIAVLHTLIILYLQRSNISIRIRSLPLRETVLHVSPGHESSLRLKVYSLEELRDIRQAFLNVGMIFGSELSDIKVNSSVFVSLVECVRCVWV